MSTVRLCTYPGCNTRVNVDPSDNTPPRCTRHAHTFTPKKVYHDHQFHKARYFYSTAEWKRARDEYIRNNPLCETCERRGYVVEAKDVDHIHEVEDGGEKLNPENFQSLCRRCHNRKSAEERRKRKERKNNNGFQSLSDF